MYHLLSTKDTHKVFIVHFLKGGYEFTWLSSANKPYNFIIHKGDSASQSFEEFVDDYAHPEDPDAAYKILYSCRKLSDITAYLNKHPELFI